MLRDRFKPASLYQIEHSPFFSFGSTLPRKSRFQHCLSGLLFCTAAFVGSAVNAADCNNTAFVGTTTTKVLRGTTAHPISIGEIWFPYGVDVSIDWRFRTLMGEPVRKFVASVALPRQVALRVGNRQTGFDIHYDANLPANAVVFDNTASAVKTLRTGRAALEGLHLAEGRLHITFPTPDLLLHSYRLDYPGLFGRAGGRGWDVDGSPSWEAAFGTSDRLVDSLEMTDLAQENRQIWCQIATSGGPPFPVKVELTDVSANFEGILSRLRYQSFEFNALLAEMQQSNPAAAARNALSGALAAAAAGGDPRAAQILDRSVGLFDLKPEQTRGAIHALEHSAGQADLQRLLDLSGEVSAHFAAGGDAAGPVTASLAAAALQMRRDLQPGSNYEGQLQDFAERVHRLTLLGRVDHYDLVLLVDRSGSMSDVFEALKSEVRALLRDLAAVRQDTRVTLIAYGSNRSPSLEAVPLTTEGSSRIEAFVSELRADGGDRDFGDVLAGLQQTEQPGRRQIVLVFGDLDDAEGKGFRAVEALSSAGRQLTVIPVWTGSGVVPTGLQSVAQATGSKAVTFGGATGIADVILSGIGLGEYRSTE